MAAIGRNLVGQTRHGEGLNSTQLGQPRSEREWLELGQQRLFAPR